MKITRVVILIQDVIIMVVVETTTVEEAAIVMIIGVLVAMTAIEEMEVNMSWMIDVMVVRQLGRMKGIIY